MSDWVMLIPLKVFTKIKQEFAQEIKDTYSMTDENFSMEYKAKIAVFPFVFVNALPGSERGQDLSGTSINGGLFSFQIDVYDSQSQTRARKVMTEVVRIMKSMGFESNSMPSFEQTQDNTVRMVTRFRRVIGAGDKF
jgi:hypothetical protein